MNPTYTREEPKIKEPRAYLEYELLAEIFQMIPSDVLADMYDLANALFYNVMKGTADRLATECPEKRREIQIAMDKYQLVAEDKLDKVFNVFQQYVSQSVWKIPDDLDVQFDQHHDIDFNLSLQDVQDVEAQIEDLRQKIMAQKSFRAVLTHTLQKQAQTEARIDNMAENLAFLDDIAQAENVQHVISTLLFVSNQINKLKDAVITVASRDVSSIPTNERSEYLRTKLHLKLKELQNQTMSK
ncbi:hypothetical protein [Parasitella parasitica]|uniref:Protein MIS12 homolog n=1 Tax=Parasitella parasitica TaxID=35722 RepID=A0A0B7N2X0_9FUNG|nr:hypothetical protein [Parasitella parasitica]